MRPSLNVRASSMAPSMNYVPKVSVNTATSSGYGSLYRDSDFTSRSSIRSVSHSVTNRARDRDRILLKAPALAPMQLQPLQQAL